MSILPWTYGALVAGIALAYFGRRGRRVDDHPVCRECGFDLTGLPTDSLRCPECGAGVVLKSVKEVGNRQTRPIVLSIGVFLAMTGGLTAAFFTAAFLLDINLLPYTPTAMILRQVDANHEAQTALAFAELKRRVTSPRNEAIIERALACQADVKTQWDPRWGDLVEVAKQAGKLKEDQWNRYLGHVLVGLYGVRSRVLLGDRILVWVDQPARRSGPALDFDADATLLLQCGGDSTEIPIGSDSSWVHDCKQVNWFPADVTARLGQGTKSVTVSERWSVRARGAFTGTAQAKTTATVKLTVLPKGTPAVELVDKPELADAVSRSLVVDRLLIAETFYYVDLHARNPPVGLAFRVFLSGDGHEFDVGTCTFQAGKENIWHLSGQARALEAPFVGTVEILLRPDPNAAASTVDLFQIYGKEVRLKAMLERQ